RDLCARSPSASTNRNATIVAGLEASDRFHSALAKSNSYGFNLGCPSQTLSASLGSDLPQIQSQFATILSARGSCESACEHSKTRQPFTCQESAPALPAAIGKSSPRSSKTSFAPTA